MSEIDVTDNTDLNRYEARIGGELAGFAEYEIRGGSTIAFVHTEVDPAFEGQGVASSLARQSLDHVRAAGQYDVITECPFYRGWVGKHPEYQDLLHTAPGA